MIRRKLRRLAICTQEMFITVCAIRLNFSQMQLLGDFKRPPRQNSPSYFETFRFLAVKKTLPAAALAFGDRRIGWPVTLRQAIILESHVVRAGNAPAVVAQPKPAQSEGFLNHRRLALHSGVRSAGAGALPMRGRIWPGASRSAARR